MQQKNFQNQRGFSLVELLVVLVLIGLIVGMATPSFIQAKRYANVTQQVNDLFVPLTRARNLAMRKQRPVLIIVQATPPNRLVFSALLDRDYVTAPGFDGTVTGSTPGSSSTTTDFQLLPSEDPFGAAAGWWFDPFYSRNGVANNNLKFSFGYPAASGSTYTASQTNLIGTTAPAYCGGNTCWFGFDAAGKLIPNGQTPFLLPAARDATGLAHLPAGLTPALNSGGPEFYFAENNAAGVTRATSHVYRKIEITPIGGIRIQSWNARNNAWRGTQ